MSPGASMAPPADAGHFIRVRGRPTPQHVAIVALTTLAIVVATSWSARNGDVRDVEAEVLLWINGWPDFFEPFMWFVQQAGVLFAPIAVGIVVAIAGRRWTLAIPFALVLPLKLLLEKAVVKTIIQRERPYTSYGEDIDVRGGAVEGLSFPSGHSTTAFATAVLLVAVLPRKWRPIPIVWAALVGIARMYMGEHNFYDVLNGAALGTLFGTILWYLVLADPRIGGPRPDESASAHDTSPPTA